jgi:hypothetical protein
LARYCPSGEGIICLGKGPLVVGVGECSGIGVLVGEGVGRMVLVFVGMATNRVEVGEGWEGTTASRKLQSRQNGNNNIKIQSIKILAIFLQIFPIR